MKILHWDTIFHLTRRALEAGGTMLTPFTTEWNVAGNCSSPVGLELYGRPDVNTPDQRHFEWLGRGFRHGMRVLMDLRCRRCDNCLRCRCRLWDGRAQIELLRSKRSWFGTLTLRPDEHYKVLCQARAWCKSRGVDFDALSFGEQFAERHRVISAEITKFLKRVRKESGAKLRYLLVAEHHKSGLPHYHVLVHEMAGDAPVSYRTLTSQWPFGFSKWKLVTDTKPARYVTKYLSKTIAARVRASIRYGDTSSDIGFEEPVRPTPQPVSPPFVSLRQGRLETVHEVCDACGVSRQLSAGRPCHEAIGGCQPDAVAGAGAQECAQGSEAVKRQLADTSPAAGRFAAGDGSRETAPEPVATHSARADGTANCRDYSGGVAVC